MDIEHKTLLPVFRKESANHKDFSDDYIVDFSNSLINCSGNPVATYHDIVQILIKNRPALAEKIKTKYNSN